MVHYYASPGVDNLTEDDYLTSQYPYSRQAEKFETMFFNFCNRNDGHTWSTPFIVDDPRLYIVNSNRVMSIVNAKKEFAARQAAARQRQETLRAQQQAASEKAASEAMTRTANRPKSTRRTPKKRSSPEPQFDLNELY